MALPGRHRFLVEEIGETVTEDKKNIPSKWKAAVLDCISRQYSVERLVKNGMLYSDVSMTIGWLVENSLIEFDRGKIVLTDDGRVAYGTLRSLTGGKAGIIRGLVENRIESMPICGVYVPKRQTVKRLPKAQRQPT